MARTGAGGFTRGCPIVWNAPGADSTFPRWAEPLLHQAFGHSQYVAVRDQASKDALAPFAGSREIAVVPDTCFGLARLVGREHPTPAFCALRKNLDLSRPYIVVQARRGLEAFCRMVRDHPEAFREYKFVALEVGPVNGDDTALIDGQLPDLVRLPHWPDPRLTAEIIAHAAGVVGVSLHLAITALTFGVPVFRPTNEMGGKYGPLRAFDLVHHFDSESGADPRWFIERLGAFAVPSAVADAVVRLDEHWDRIAAIFARSERHAAPAELAAFWSTLPTWLEDGAHAGEVQIEALSKEVAEKNSAIADCNKQIATQDFEIAELRRQIGNRDAVFWRLTAPVRWVGRRIKRNGKKYPRGLLRFDRLRQQALAEDPYQWAFANALFSSRDARALATSFPRDRFKTVKGHDDEKGYEYESRALIDMGGDSPIAPEGLSPAWRQLIDDLLSPAYRTAMTRISGRDLMTAPMEAYACHYGPGAWLGPHIDLKEKILTHVFYFNQDWDCADGGCLSILKSADMSDIVSEIPPNVGNSSVLLRSENSWHSVSRVVRGCQRSRRSMNVIFYHPGAVSTMWPPGDASPLHDYDWGEDAVARGSEPAA